MGRSAVACWPAPVRRPAAVVGFYSPVSLWTADESGAGAGSVWVWRSTESSIPGSVKPPKPVGWQQVSDAFRAAELYWLTTVRATRARTSPRCRGVGGRRVRVLHRSRGTEGAEPQPQHGGGRHHGVNTWNDGLDVIVEGDAQRVTGLDTLTKLADIIREKYDGDWDFTPDRRRLQPHRRRRRQPHRAMSSGCRPAKCWRSRSHRTARRRSASRPPTVATGSGTVDYSSACS